MLPGRSTIAGTAAGGAKGRVLRRRAEAALELLGDRPGDVLDAGMGGGVLLAELDRRGWRVSGIDIAPSMVARTRERLPHARDRLLEASIDELPVRGRELRRSGGNGTSWSTRRTTSTAPWASSSACSARVESSSRAFPNYEALATRWRAHAHYPLVRFAKRHTGSRRPSPPRMPLVPFSRFRAVLEQHGLGVEDVKLVGARPLPRGLPLARRAVRRAGGKGRWLRRAGSLLLPSRPRRLATVARSRRRPGDDHDRGRQRHGRARRRGRRPGDGGAGRPPARSVLRGGRRFPRRRAVRARRAASGGGWAKLPRRGDRRGPATRGTAAPRPRPSCPVSTASRRCRDGGFVLADTGNNRIRRVSPTGTITTIAGTGAAGFSGDGGPAIAAQITGPRGITSLPDGSDPLSRLRQPPRAADIARGRHHDRRRQRHSRDSRETGAPRSLRNSICRSASRRLPTAGS